MTILIIIIVSMMAGCGAPGEEMETDSTNGPVIGNAGSDIGVTVAAQCEAATCEPGPIGLTGPTGLPGADGLSGLQGPQGLPGQDGTNGTKGVDGTNGTDGAKGDKGDSGTNGTNGTNGITGAKGDKGDQGNPGTNGNDGSDGSQGLQGLKGDTGATGAAGSPFVWVDATGTPVPGFLPTPALRTGGGQSRAYYLDPATDTLWLVDQTSLQVYAVDSQLYEFGYTTLSCAGNKHIFPPQIGTPTLPMPYVPFEVTDSLGVRQYRIRNSSFVGGTGQSICSLSSFGGTSCELYNSTTPFCESIPWVIPWDQTQLVSKPTLSVTPPLRMIYQG